MGSGDAAKKFSLHADTVTAHSSHIARKAQSEIKYPDQRSFSFPDLHPEIFEVFVDFIYEGKVRRQNGDEHDGLTNTEWLWLVDSWLLGHFLGSDSFMDAVVDTIRDQIRRTNTYPNLHATIYEATAGPCALRRFAVDLAVSHWGEIDLVEFKATHKHLDTTDDLVKRLFEIESVAERKIFLAESKALRKRAEFSDDLVQRLFEVKNVQQRKAVRSICRQSKDCSYHEHIISNTPCYKDTLLRGEGMLGWSKKQPVGKAKIRI